MSGISVQVGVDRVNLPIEVHRLAMLSLKNPIKHLFNLVLLSRWWCLLVVGVFITPVVAAVVVAVGFLVLRTLVEITPLSIAIEEFLFPLWFPEPWNQVPLMKFTSSSTSAIPSVSTTSTSSTKQTCLVRSL